MAESESRRDTELLGLWNECGHPVPLKSINVTVDVRGHIASVSSILTYSNEEESPVEAVFTFPADDGSAVFSFTADIDGRFIVAEIQEKEQAELTYQDAVDAGKTAALIKQADQCSDVFKCSLGNLPPKSTAILTLKYALELPIEPDGRVRFTLPRVLNPRYSPDAGGEVAAESATYAPPSKIPYSFTLSASVKSNIRIVTVTSDRQNLDVKLTDNQRGAEVHLKDAFLFDHDLTLYVQYAEPFQPQVVFEKGKPDAVGPYLQEDVLMLSFYPDLKEVTMATSGEYIFVIDCSGSMHGEPIEMAKQALLLFLKSLPHDCYFNVVRFGSQYEDLFSSGSKPYNKKTLEDGLKIQKNLKADLGGTEILEPLVAIFKKDAIKGHMKNIFVLTDGGVSNTDAVIGLVKQNAKSARVFSLGIGHGVSTSLVKGLARAGNGFNEIVHDSSKIQAKVISLLKNAMQPCVSNINVQWELPPDVTPYLIPEELPVVICAQQRLTLYALLKGVNQNVIYGPSSIRLNGDCQDGPVSFEFSFTLSDDVDETIQSLAPVHRLACKTKIQLLEDLYTAERDVSFRSYGREAVLKDLRKQINEVSLHANLMSKMMAFVAVDMKGSTIDSKMVTRPCPVPTISQMMAFDAVDMEGSTIDSKRVTRPWPVITISQNFIDPSFKRTFSSCNSSYGADRVHRLRSSVTSHRVYDTSSRSCNSSHRRLKGCGLFDDADVQPCSESKGGPLLCRSVPTKKSKGFSFNSSPFKFFKRKGSKSAKMFKVVSASPALLSRESDENSEVDAGQTDTMMAVISMQEISGQWTPSKHLSDLLGVEEDKLQPSPPIGDKDVRCTLAVLNWLRSRHAQKQEEWQVIEAKAILWLQTQSDLQNKNVEQLIVDVGTKIFGF